MNLNEAEDGTLVKQGEALYNIVEELKLLPAFKSLLQDCLSEPIWKIAPEALVSKLYVNVLEGVGQPAREPVGRVLNIVLDCLKRGGRAPRYAAGEYAVYDLSNSTNPRDIVPEISITAMEKIFGDLLKDLSNTYIAELKKYWEIMGPRKSSGSYPQISRKAALGVLQSILFTRELDSFAANGGITPREMGHISMMVQPGLTGVCYGIYLEGRNGEYVEQNSMFVLSLNNPVYEQLIPGTDGACVLYSPNRGIERFTSSLKLHQTLVSRVQSLESRAEFLQTLPINEQEGFAYGPDIRFLKVHANLFDRYTDQTLRKAYSDVAYHLGRLSMGDSDLDRIMAAVESTQSLGEVPRLAKQRHAQLLKLVARNAWPQWLKNAADVNQEVYEALQHQLLEAEVALHETTVGMTSLSGYGRAVVENHISPGTDERVNPDNVFVNVIHTVALANGQKVQLNERKTLTQAFIYGPHDDAGQYRIALEEFSNNPKLTPVNMLYAIEKFNVRVNFDYALRLMYAKPEVINSLREVLARRIALSVFSAILQKHVPPFVQDLVIRYNQGDPSIEQMQVSLRNRFRPLNGLLIYRKKSADADRGVHVLYIPGFTTGQEWFQFDSLKSLQYEVARWMVEKETWSYLKARSYASDSSMIEADYLAHQPHLLLQEWWWSGITLKGMSEEGFLMGAVLKKIVWDRDQAEIATPEWFRTATIADQKLFNRLSSDFKVLHDYSKERLEIVPFKEFARKLVQEELKRYFNRSGTEVDINPDEVWVKFHAQSKISLTELFIQWQLWRSDVNAFQRFISYRLPYGYSLVDLQDALRSATFWTFSNQPIAQLSANVINDLIDLMPGEKYVEYLKKKFVYAADVGLKVELYRRLKQNEMLKTALIQKMNHSLSQEEYNAVTGMIKSMDNDVPGAAIGGVTPGLGIYELTLSGRRLEGAYVFSRMLNGQLQSIVYIPNTSDGRDFFPYSEFGARLRNALRIKETILRLVRLEDQVVVQNEIDRFDNWKSPSVLPSPTVGNSFKIKSFTEVYTSMIERFLADVDYQTSSPSEVFWRDARILAEFALDVASMFIPPLGLALSLLRITESVVRALVASSQGLDAAANAHFASAWRGAIMLYVGKVAAIGAPVNPIALLSSIKDIADIMTAVTGVEVSVSYLTAVAAPPPAVDSTTRLLN
ncbi:dermonecrotic toxin domain-containing protein [Pseudomonas fluorescens]|uniref:dermonecrotic toxin domain-containing protein n=1 Tax=Pseudomonas fluorescens TaxID=294 RepID=UPI0012400DF7|nr:DUF6543 domain-containing protein [Pseudomonas fluorescens]